MLFIMFNLNYLPAEYFCNVMELKPFWELQCQQLFIWKKKGFYFHTFLLTFRMNAKVIVLVASNHLCFLRKWKSFLLLSLLGNNFIIKKFEFGLFNFKYLCIRIISEIYSEDLIWNQNLKKVIPHRRIINFLWDN